MKAGQAVDKLLLLDPLKGVVAEFLGLILFFVLLYYLLGMLWKFMKANMKALGFLFNLMETVAGAIFKEVGESDFDSVFNQHTLAKVENMTDVEGESDTL